MKIATSPCSVSRITHRYTPQILQKSVSKIHDDVSQLRAHHKRAIKAHSTHSSRAIKFSGPSGVKTAPKQRTKRRRRTCGWGQLHQALTLIQWTPYLLAYKIYYSSNIIAVACSIFIASWTACVNSTMTFRLPVYTGWPREGNATMVALTLVKSLGVISSSFYYSILLQTSDNLLFNTLLNHKKKLVEISSVRWHGSANTSK